MKREVPIGEWACLGILVERPAHGWAVAGRLRPDGDVGRVWHLSRPLTYRALDQLALRGWVAPCGEEPGAAGPNRTILAVTALGHEQFRRWIDTPTRHHRDLRSHLLLKLVLAERLGIDPTAMLAGQRDLVDRLVDALDTDHDTDHDDARRPDVVRLWRLESARAARRFLEHLASDDAR